MSEAQWSDEEPLPKKKSIPAWIWFCSAGCLLAVVAVVVLAFFGATFLKGALDPEQQWPALEALLPFDERPDELTMVMGMNLGIAGQKQFTLQDSRGYQAQFMHLSGGQGTAMRKKMFESEKPTLMGGMGIVTLEDAEKSEVEIQGRTLSVVRAKMDLPGLDLNTTWVDLTPEGETGFFYLQYQGLKQDSEYATDDELREFFEPFHVGPNR